MRVNAIALIALLYVGCPVGTGAYGLSGDDRLDEATRGIDDESGGPAAGASEAEALQMLAAENCDDAEKNLTELSNELDEEGRLAGLIGLVGQLRGKQKKIDAILEGSSGLEFFNGRTADGTTYNVADMVRACETPRITAEGDLDLLIRDILRLPVVEEIEGKGRRRRSVPKARVEFDLLERAVQVLAPADADSLHEEIRSAKARIAAASENGNKKKKRRKKKGR